MGKGEVAVDMGHPNDWRSATETQDRFEWSVAIFASREPITVLKATIIAAANACEKKHTLINILVNGNETLATETATFIHGLSQRNDFVTFRVWSIPLGDKAHAWNNYLYDIEPHAEIAFYIDGYAEVMPDAFMLIALSLRENTESLAASGVPSCGRSAAQVREKMLVHGGINGSLYAIRGSVMDKLRKIEFHLPIGIYRTDSLLGSVLCFNLRPGQNKWNASNIQVHPDATWRIPDRKMTNIGDVRSYFRRRHRQALGMLENAAVKQHLAVNRDRPENLPEFSSELILHWVRSSKKRLLLLCLRNWRCLPALIRTYKQRNLSTIDQPGHMIAERLHTCQR